MMFNARGGDYGSYYANIKKHLGQKSVRDLSAELDEIMDYALVINIEIDPHLAVAYMDVIQELDPQTPEEDSADDLIPRFVSSHPEWFTPIKVSEYELTPNLKPKENSLPVRRNLGLLKLFVAAMGITMALLMASYGQQAWNTAVEIGSEVLHIGPGLSGALELEETGVNGYHSLAEALEKNNILTGIAPNWIPGELSIQYVDAQHIETVSVVTALYSGQNLDCVIRIKSYEGKLPDIGYEMSEDTEHTYIVGNIKHYIVRNNERVTAVWENESCYCSISGTISEQQIKRIIDSIYEG